MKGSTTGITFFKSIFESSVEGILVVDERGELKMANTASERFFEYGKDELCGRNIEQIIPQKFRKAHKIQRLPYNQEPEKRAEGKEMNLLGLKKDGTEFPMDISLTQNNFEGRPVTVAFLKNTTKRRKEELLLEKSNVALTEINRRYSTLIGNLQGIVFRCRNDRDFTMEFISDGCLSVTGYPPRAFLEGREQYGKVIVPDDKEKVWNGIQNALVDRENFDVIYRIRDKEGNIKYIRESGVGIFDEKGKVEALEGFMVDITDSKNTEEKLWRKEAKNQALLAAIPDMMFIQNRKGDYLDWYANDFDKLFMRPEKFMGMKMKKVLPPHVYQKIRSSHERVMQSQKMQLAEFSVQGKEGIEHYEARVALLNENALLTIVRNVTQAKAMQDILHIRNSALQAAGNGIIISDARQKDIPIIYANDAFCKMTVYDHHEVLGRNCRFLQKKDRDQEDI